VLSTASARAEILHYVYSLSVLVGSALRDINSREQIVDDLRVAT